MDVPSADHPPLPLTIAEPTRFAGVAAIADLYPGMSAEEKRSMIEQDLGPAFAASLERRRTILLATVGDRLVGTVQVAWENAAEEPALLPPGAAVIHHFRTHPDYRRRGIGRRLMDEVERLARRRNVAVLTLGVEPANANARRLYAKWGFREFLTYRGRQGAAMIGMRKRLAPA
jgi:ribosomal protein S18 acetylase RimI-like enzyme